MKHILISVKPQYVEKILNKEKLLEIRKSVPKELLNGEEYIVEIYCTKGNKNLYIPQEFCAFELDEFSKPYLAKEPILEDCDYLANGKVVAEFTLMYYNKFDVEGLDWWGMKDIMLKDSCLTETQLKDYLGDKIGYAWHIEDSHIYDKPKELAEFGLKRPPQSWCYIEGE